MPRPAVHTTDHILDVARDLVLAGGVRAATVDQVVAGSGAPKGSIYHRFATINDLLATAWLRAVQSAQARFIVPLDDVEDPIEAAVAAGLSTLDYAIDEPADARLLGALRREDLLAGVQDPDLASALIDANDAMGAAIAGLARRLYGRASQAALGQTVCATVDIPLGAVRRYLDAGTPPPRRLRGQLEAAIRAVLAA